MSNTIVTRKPFHEVVVELIPQLSSDELAVIGSLLIRSTIPKDHDKIVEAWNKRCTEMCWVTENIAYVADDVLAHKFDLERQSSGSDNPLDRFRFSDEKHA